MSAGERGDLEDGTVMLYGTLRVGEEEFLVQANAEMLDSSVLTSQSAKVRTSISSKTSEREGEIQYTLVAVDLL